MRGFDPRLSHDLVRPDDRGRERTPAPAELIAVLIAIRASGLLAVETANADRHILHGAHLLPGLVACVGDAEASPNEGKTSTPVDIAPVDVPITIDLSHMARESRFGG
jgi:hypothetical protein